MPQIHSQNLPLTHRKYLHQDFLENERDYWKMRDRLVQEYQGQWVAVHGGKVMASSNDLFDVTDEVGKLGCHAYIARVGEEQSLVFTIRRREFSYDVSYRPFALPRVEAAFSNFHRTGRYLYPDVIPLGHQYLPLYSLTPRILYQGVKILDADSGQTTSER